MVKKAKVVGPSQRVFSGVTYKLVARFHKKSGADKRCNSLRKKGTPARIFQEPKKSDYKWAVFRK